MSRTRIYQNATLTLGDTIKLTENASHHLARVLRAETNTPIILFNGDGNEYTAIISKIDKKNVYASIQDISTINIESPIDIILAQGIARGEKMDFIIQKAVELGVKKIYPLITERCNVRLDNEREEKKYLHWQSIIISACEQCGRTRLPSIAAPQTIDTWLAQQHQQLCFVLSPHVTHKLPQEKLPSHSSITILIGPEGGLSDQEVARATSKGFQAIHLGPRVLRTETATIAAISTLQAKYGDFS
jgi:16S rRNA (uracil1498-N3)-methyltransferase